MYVCYLCNGKIKSYFCHPTIPGSRLQGGHDPPPQTPPVFLPLCNMTVVAPNSKLGSFSPHPLNLGSSHGLLWPIEIMTGIDSVSSKWRVSRGLASIQPSKRNPAKLLCKPAQLSYWRMEEVKWWVVPLLQHPSQSLGLWAKQMVILSHWFGGWFNKVKANWHAHHVSLGRICFLFCEMGRTIQTMKDFCKSFAVISYRVCYRL